MEEKYTPTIREKQREEHNGGVPNAQEQAEKKRTRRTRFCKLLVFCLILCLVSAGVLFAEDGSPAEEQKEELASELPAEESTPEPVQTEPAPPPVFSPVKSDATVELDETFPSLHAIVVDLQTSEILAEKNADAEISPASMTKILTLLTAVEHLDADDLDQTFQMTDEIAHYCYSNDCSIVGLLTNEPISVRDMLYGTILPSGADAALGLACYISGSQEAFVQLMNEKLEELHLSDTAHFTNCVGLYDPEHHCTVKDMAVILEAAMENDLCREVLRQRTHALPPTADHPDGQMLSNWFLRRIEDKDTGDIQVIGAKTGYVSQAGSCAASCGEDSLGNRYICVTANTYSSWRAIYDHVELYSRFCNSVVAPEDTVPPVENSGEETAAQPSKAPVNSEEVSLETALDAPAEP